MIRLVLSWLTGGGIASIGRELRLAQQARLAAKDNEEARAHEGEIRRLEAAQSIALAEAGEGWSATRLGRLLIVVPFGVWWSAVFADSIFAFPFDILDLPPRIWDMAQILVPAIVIADAGALTAKRFARVRN